MTVQCVQTQSIVHTVDLYACHIAHLHHLQSGFSLVTEECKTDAQEISLYFADN